MNGPLKLRNSGCDGSNGFRLLQCFQKPISIHLCLAIRWEVGRPTQVHHDIRWSDFGKCWRSRDTPTLRTGIFRPQCITYWSPTWVSDICQRLMITYDHNMNCIRQWQTPPWYETPCINSHVISKMTWADRSDWEILAVLGWTCYTRVLVCVMFGSHITSVVISGPFKLMDFGCDGSIGFHIMRWVS